MSGQPEPKQKPEPTPIENASEQPLSAPEKVGAKPVSQESLAAAWQSFANVVKTEDTRLYSILSANEPILTGETKIVFHYNNPLQNEPLQKIQTRLLQHLKTALDNEKIETEMVLEEKNEPVKAYTLEDKFAEMSRKNPSLLTFRQQFALEFG